jgi:protein TonB
MMEHTPPQPTAVSPVKRAEPIHERTEEVVQAAPSMIEHRAVQQRLVQYRQTQADYGWLRDALWRRIEDLKRYPTQARANHWEGKVVVKAVIRDDGTVVDLMIAESSGQPILDQEALAVMMKASPLILKHPLGKPSITMLIPISYRLDG